MTCCIADPTNDDRDPHQSPHPWKIQPAETGHLIRCSDSIDHVAEMGIDHVAKRVATTDDVSEHVGAHSSEPRLKRRSRNPAREPSPSNAHPLRTEMGVTDRPLCQLAADTYGEPDFVGRVHISPLGIDDPTPMPSVIQRRRSLGEQRVLRQRARYLRLSRHDRTVAELRANR